MTFMISVPSTAGRSFRGVRQQRHRPGPLDRLRELTLVTVAAARDAPRDDLAALGHEALEASHVLVIDQVDLVDAELADLPPPEPAALDWLGSCWWNRGSSSEGNFVVPVSCVVAAAERGLGRRGHWRGHRRARRLLATPHELHALGHHLHHVPLLAVLRLPVPGLQASFDENRAPLVEVLTATLRLFAPDDHRQEARFFPALSALRRVPSVHGEPQIADGGAARRVAQLGGSGQVPDQEHLVQARHQPTSSTTSGAFAGRAFLRTGTRVDMNRRTFSLSRSWRSNSLIIAGSADASRTAYVPSRCFRISYARRRFPQFSTLVTSAPRPFRFPSSVVRSAATSSSVGRESMVTRTS